MTSLLIQTCIPLALLILLGYVLGRLNTIEMKSVATLTIYGITPIVAFGSAARLDFTPSLLLLPLCTFLIALVIGLSTFKIGSLLNDHSLRCLLPVACGSGNTGYFGFPVAIALFGPDSAGLYFLANLGVSIFETSIGFYFIARGHYSPQDALKRVLRLPTIYALTAGLVVAAFHWHLPEEATKLWDLCKGAYIVLGMTIAGLALSQVKGFSFNLKLVGITLIGKFFFWPTAAIVFALLDHYLFSPDIHKLIIVLSLTPVAANLPAFAAANNLPIRDAAMLVLGSTILAILGLPHILPILLNI